jgi:cation transporter-like permease
MAFTSEQMWGYGLLFAMLLSVATTMMYVTGIAAKNDSAAATIQAIQGMSIANFILIVVFSYMVSYYLESHPAMTPTYIFFMLHATLFLSLMAVSVAALQQLN